MVAPTWCHGPDWGNLIVRNFKRLGFRIDTFTLVIRVSKVKQSALFRFSPRWSKCWTTGCCTWLHVFVRCKCQLLKPPFICSPSMRRRSQQHGRHQACPFPAGVVSFVFGEVKSNCAPNSGGSAKLLHVHCGWTDYDPVMGTTHDLVSNLGLNPCNFCCSCVFIH